MFKEECAFPDQELHGWLVHGSSTVLCVFGITISISGPSTASHADTKTLKNMRAETVQTPTPMLMWIVATPAMHSKRRRTK